MDRSSEFGRGEELDGIGRGAALVKNSFGGTLEEVAHFRPTMLVIFG